MFEAIKGITFPMLLAFAGLGYALDYRVKATRRQGVDPLLVLGLLFFLWVMVTVTVNVPEQFQDWLLYFAGPAGLFLALSQGVQTLRGLRVVTKTLLAVTLLIEVIAVQQGFSPTVCLVDDRQVAPVPGLENGSELRPCKTRAECAETGVPWRDYLCEHVGAMETSSITGRIRYRGVFQDPNELAWAISLSLPFVFSWFGGRERSFWQAGGQRGAHPAGARGEHHVQHHDPVPIGTAVAGGHAGRLLHQTLPVARGGGGGVAGHPDHAARRPDR